MKCPVCGHDKTEITGTDSKYDTLIRRYRRCLNKSCGWSFNTCEEIIDECRAKEFVSDNSLQM